MTAPFDLKPGTEFTCPHCEARYVVSVTPLADQDRDSVNCLCCARVMREWQDKVSPTFTLLDQGH
ncbi:MAG: hypothetical protein ACPGNV_12695 [Mangrovicoccus sp.]